MNRMFGRAGEVSEREMERGGYSAWAVLCISKTKATTVVRILIARFPFLFLLLLLRAFQCRVIDDITLYEAPVQNIHDKQLVFPYRQAGDASQWQLGMRVRATVSFAVRVSITAEFTNELTRLGINDLDAMLSRHVYVAFVIQRLVNPVGAADTVRIRRDETHSVIAVPGLRPDLFSGWREFRHGKRPHRKPFGRLGFGPVDTLFERSTIGGNMDDVQIPLPINLNALHAGKIQHRFLLQFTG